MEVSCPFPAIDWLFLTGNNHEKCFRWYMLGNCVCPGLKNKKIHILYNFKQSVLKKTKLQNAFPWLKDDNELGKCVHGLSYNSGVQ